MEKKELQKLKDDFLSRQILSVTISGGLGRSKIYKQEVSENQRGKFRQYLMDRLALFRKKYKNRISDKDHVENIQRLANEVTQQYGNILLSGLRFGVAQKLINLYLKYLWILNKIPPPPHCPFDSMISQKLKSPYKWTKSDKKEQYNNIVTKIQNVANKQGCSIAEWELKEWSPIAYTNKQ